MILKDLEYALPEMKAGSHILYIFNQIDKYIQNAVNFILDGLQKDEVVLFVDTKESFEKIINELRKVGYNSNQLQNLLFVESTETYVIDNQFNLDKTGDLINILNPYNEKGCSIRTWGQVLLTDHETTLERLRVFECNSDAFITKSNLISVCAYNGLTLSAYQQNELMRTHTHFMTDNEYISSPLYDRNYLTIPSIEEMRQFRKIAKQNKELIDKNSHLAYENKIMSMKNKVITESEQKLRTLIDQLPNPIIVRRDSRVLFVNDIAKRQFSINSQSINEEHHLYHFFEKYIKDPVVVKNNKFQNHDFILYNGEEKFYIVKSIELNFEGEPSVLHSFLDISQEKANEKLVIRSEKMNIAGELAASIAHEIRNPLTAIKGFFQLINRENEHEMYYSVIDDELSRIEQITSELLTLAKPHSEKRQNHNIVQLIKEVKFLLTSQANSKSIEIIQQAKCRESYIFCDETKIKQVFINLLKNAIDSMKSGGKIILKIDEIGNNIEVQVIDQGNGIPKELLNKIGEPFYTTKEKGTGIGLMVCFRIIESHEGTIRVESETGVGTTFTITLPVSKELAI